jgi:ribonuclease P protein component
MARLKFPKTRRLSGEKQFAAVFAKRVSVANRLIVVYAAPNGLKVSRLGLSVGRRLGTAVTRNRIKRLVREAFRLDAGTLPSGFDLVVVPRKGPIGTLNSYRDAMIDAIQRAISRKL